MENIDDSNETNELDENYDNNSVNPNLIRPKDTYALERYMASLPLSLRPTDQASETTSEGL